MATGALILDENSLRPRTSARAPAATAARVQAPAPAPIAVWPPATPDFAAYRADAAHLRSQAISDALRLAGVWLRGRLID